MTQPTARGPHGYLEARVETKSIFLSNNLPYVVRDAHHAVVHEGVVGGNSRVELPTGLYTVSAVTPDGRQVSDVVQVSPAATTAVVLGENRTAQPGQVESVSPEIDRGSSKQAQASLITTTGCKVEQAEDAWVFSPLAALDAVPTAEFSVDEGRAVVSLPVNPAGKEPKLQACRVVAEFDAGRTRLVVRFGHDRRVSRMINGLLRNNEASSATAVLDAATDLLLEKYSDPTGAALGGLTLHRLGQLPQRRSWVENLARDFRWLPDGQILLAGLLRPDQSETERRRGLDLLLGATTMRPLYTDGLSLALELLRRWPDEHSGEKRTERLGRLAEFSAYADWGSVCLTTETGANM